MKGVGLIALVLAAALAVQPGWAARKSAKKPASNCPTAATAEAEAGLRYMTQLGIASNACTSMGVYADFRVRNRDAIVAYQKTMIANLHGNAAFDRWNTSLANELAQQQSSMVPAQFCQQSVPLLKQAGTFDLKAFRAYAAAQGATLQSARCGK
ncbi:MAG TPA: hypothetical protein VJR70_02110 [Stellaceae bacterium]|nr:hypothetical protein [Stellaceae bacterium]